MKYNFILFLLLLSLGIQAQNLETYIPHDAQLVAEMSGDQIFSLVKKSEIEKVLPPDRSGTPADLDQYGFNLNSKAYFFRQVIDSMDYNTILIKIADVNKASELIQSMLGPESKKVNGFSWIAQSSMSAGWNNGMAILTQASVPKVVYTMDDLLKEKEEITGDTYTYDAETSPEEKEQLDTELKIKNMFAPNRYSEEVIAERMQNFFNSVVKSTRVNSVLKHPSYTSGKLKNSSAYFWMNDVDKLINEATPKDGIDMFFSKLKDLPSIKTGINALSGNLVFDKDQVNMKLDMNLDKRVAASYKKMYNNKLDRSFVRYFNPDEALAYMSLSFDMEETLRGNGEVLKMLYEPMLKQAGFVEEADLALDMLDMIIDEEAIAEFITGDAVLVLHDVEDREVTYKTTEWDEDLNAVEVEKTKKEMLPSFTFMLGSENKKMINKLLRIGKKHGIVSNESNYTLFASGGMVPFDMYLTQQDDIVFLTNEKDMIQKYVNRKRKCSYGKHKKLVRNEPFRLYLNTSRGMEKAAKMMPGEVSKIDHITKNFKAFVMSMSPIKDDKMTYDIVLKTDDSKENALKVIIDALTAK